MFLLFKDKLKLIQKVKILKGFYHINMKARKIAEVSSESNFIISGKQRFSGGHAESVGTRPSMEDCSAIIGDFLGIPNSQYYALFDGHGGGEVSNYCARNLHLGISSLYQRNNNIEQSIQEAIDDVDKYTSVKWPAVGCTAVIVVIIEDDIYIANVGDSRAILVENGIARRCTVDHRSADPEEKKGVIERGGIVQNDRVNGTLMLSRSIGDGNLGRAVSTEAHFEKASRKDGMKLIMACDGVWDVMTDQMAVDILMKCNNIPEAAKAIKDESLKLETKDNVSCIVVDLTPKKE